MARVAPLLVHLHPPIAFGDITLDRFSPYFMDPLQNGIKNVRPWTGYKFIYPLHEKDLQKIAYRFDFDYCDDRNPASYKTKLKRELFNWQKLWEGNDRRTPYPVLNSTRQGDLIMINDTRPCSVKGCHLLANQEAMIYELCQTVHSIQTIFMKARQEYPLIAEEEIRNVLSDLLDKKLMLCDNDKYLSLAIPVMSESEHEHSKLAELLLRLQEDSKLLAEFDKDPDKVMIEAGISSEEYRNIIKTRDIIKIRQLLLEKRNIHTSNSK